MEADRCDGMRAEITPLSSLEVRIENESPLIDSFHENDSHRRSPVHSDRRERHRIRIRKNRAVHTLRLCVEPVESAERILYGIWGCHQASVGCGTENGGYAVAVPHLPLGVFFQRQRET